MIFRFFRFAANIGDLLDRLVLVFILGPRNVNKSENENENENVNENENGNENENEICKVQLFLELPRFGILELTDGLSLQLLVKVRACARARLCVVYRSRRSLRL